MDQCISMNKTSQSSSSKIQTIYYYTLPPLTPHPNSHSQRESTEQSLHELRAMFEQIYPYISAFTVQYLMCHSMSLGLMSPREDHLLYKFSSTFCGSSSSASAHEVFQYYHV